MPAREAMFQPRSINRRKANGWSVEFLVESEYMLTSNVMYENIATKRRIYLNRISDEEYDMLQAFNVEFVNHHTFLKNWEGVSYWYINDGGATVFVEVINPH
jgi:hypothetical protein